MRSVAIAGGAGFIGSNLASQLLAAGHRVTIVDNLITGSAKNIDALRRNKYCSFIQEDVASPSILHLLKDMKFDILFHLASPASPRQYIKKPIETMLANSQGTLHLLQHAVKSGKTVFVYASTSEVYGDPLVHPQNESYWGNVNPNGPRSCYDESKRFGEAMCMTFFRLYRTDVRIARIFNTYGPNMQKDDGRVVSNFIVQALKGKDITIYGNGNQTRSFCYVTDMVGGLTALAERGKSGEVVNLGNVNESRIVDIAHTVKKMTRSKSKIVFKPLPEDDPKRRKPDMTKALTTLSFKADVSLEQGLQETIAYFKKRFGL